MNARPKLEAPAVSEKQPEEFLQNQFKGAETERFHSVKEENNSEEEIITKKQKFTDSKNKKRAI
jgi:hypothetical protein